MKVKAGDCAIGRSAHLKHLLPANTQFGHDLHMFQVPELSGSLKFKNRPFQSVDLIVEYSSRHLSTIGVSSGIQWVPKLMR